jgi:hypothetical protein
MTMNRSPLTETHILLYLSYTSYLLTINKADSISGYTPRIICRIFMLLLVNRTGFRGHLFDGGLGKQNKFPTYQTSAGIRSSAFRLKKRMRTAPIITYINRDVILVLRVSASTKRYLLT